ncbi:hypothetical protein HaLaN_17239 [Haematococcus lacustris]|uniref:Uncharacterized protein n=1 Tax=Haematococcus lacustris TaxID=44745 RepID=A0A699ZG26_HAELA|nr:hypothetical protein HaLaN_17239 [Haematococcus lacustris]
MELPAVLELMSMRIHSDAIDGVDVLDFAQRLPELRKEVRREEAAAAMARQTAKAEMKAAAATHRVGQVVVDVGDHEGQHRLAAAYALTYDGRDYSHTTVEEANKLSVRELQAYLRFHQQEVMKGWLKPKLKAEYGGGLACSPEPIGHARILQGGKRPADEPDSRGASDRMSRRVAGEVQVFLCALLQAAGVRETDVPAQGSLAYSFSDEAARPVVPFLYQRALRCGRGGQYVARGWRLDAVLVGKAKLVFAVHVCSQALVAIRQWGGGFAVGFVAEPGLRLVPCGRAVGLGVGELWV